MSLPIFNFDKIESTNDFARKLITDHKILKGIVTADEQTKGRGRFGNNWKSPKGNLHFSIFFPILRSNLKKIQFLAQLQVGKILKTYGVRNISLKWPNDIYVKDKKICGILQESIMFNKFFLIIGIGINIKSSPKIKKYPTTYLNKEVKQKIGISVLDIELGVGFDGLILLIKNIHLKRL